MEFPASLIQASCEDMILPTIQLLWMALITRLLLLLLVVTTLVILIILIAMSTLTAIEA